MSEFTDNLPKIEPGQFVIPLKDNEEVNALVCVRELTWVEAAEIEYTKYRIEAGKYKYFNGEAERRETLRKVIVWTADIIEEIFVDASRSNILSMLDSNAVDVIWEQYSILTSLSGTEQATLYDSALRFFSGEPAGSGPVPPMVMIVDAMDKGLCSMSLHELKNLSNSEHERLMICFKAKQQSKPSVQPSTTSGFQKPSIDISSYPPGFFPPGVRP